MIDCSLDTCVVIDLIKGRKSAEKVVSRFAHLSISYVVLGELLLGGHKASNPQERDKILHALEGITILNGNTMTAAIYAELRFDLEQQGTIIPQNDIWIAAISLQISVPLLTRDEHFRRIPKLKLLEY
jgi:predicted nucleic acid-binding protein